MKESMHNFIKLNLVYEINYFIMGHDLGQSSLSLYAFWVNKTQRPNPPPSSFVSLSSSEQTQ